MLNAYPDSIGCTLADTMQLLGNPLLEGAFSLFYVLPTFFHSDLDRGFSVIDYDMNEELVSLSDLDQASRWNISFKFDLVLNHMSVGSPQFQDMLDKGDDSEYRDFFIDWNEFWLEHGTLGPGGIVMPDERYLEKLFMRKPDLPILRVCFPDGSQRLYWNTFYQEVKLVELVPHDFVGIEGIHLEQAIHIASAVNAAIAAKADLEFIVGTNIADIAGKQTELAALNIVRLDSLGDPLIAASLGKLTFGTPSNPGPGKQVMGIAWLVAIGLIGMATVGRRKKL